MVEGGTHDHSRYGYLGGSHMGFHPLGIGKQRAL
jgi:hypothetical protein